MEGLANYFRNKWMIDRAKEGIYKWLNYLVVGLMYT
jgi:hypothetical protein